LPILGVFDADGMSVSCGFNSQAKDLKLGA
jgi:hypothetical protein